MLCFLLLFAQDQTLNGLKELLRSKLPVATAEGGISMNRMKFSFHTGEPIEIDEAFFGDSIEDFKRFLTACVPTPAPQVAAAACGSSGTEGSWHKPIRIGDFYFKPLAKETETPENDMVCFSYYKTLEMQHLIVRTLLTKVTYSDGLEQFFQVSKKAGDKNLEEYFAETTADPTQRKLNKVDCALHFIVNLLLKPGDAKAANFVVDTSDPNDHRLLAIDNEMIGRPRIKYYKERDGYLAGIHSVFFFEKARSELGLSDCIPEAVYQKVSNIFPFSLMPRWEREILKFDKEYRFFKGEAASIDLWWKIKGKRAFSDHQKTIKLIIDTISKNREGTTYEELLLGFDSELAAYYKKRNEDFGCGQDIHKKMIFADRADDVLPFYKDSVSFEELIPFIKNKYQFL